MFVWVRIFALMTFATAGFLLAGCETRSRHTSIGSMSIAAPEVVSFKVLEGAERVSFVLHNPAARVAFDGAYFTLNCTDKSGRPVGPGLLIVSQKDRAGALRRLAEQDISHVVELPEPWAPRGFVAGEISLRENDAIGIAHCTGMTLKGAW